MNSNNTAFNSFNWAYLLKGDFQKYGYPTIECRLQLYADHHKWSLMFVNAIKKELVDLGIDI